jgi:hypothetical protein
MEMRKADVINDEVRRVLQADIYFEETLIVARRDMSSSQAAQATPRR